MNQNIEELLFTTLSQAISQDPQLVKQAEQNLSAWEKETNFYKTVLSFYCNPQVDESVRYMAILTLKNGIDKHWRKTQTKYDSINLCVDSSSAMFSLF
jgi:Importin-beta N-terminal domain